MVNLMVILSQTGSGTHGREFALALNRFQKICLRPIHGVIEDLAPKEEPLAREMCRRRHAHNRVGILIRSSHRDGNKT